MLSYFLHFASRAPYMRQRKLSLGHVIAKSQTVTGWSDAYFGLDFEVNIYVHTCI